MRDMTLEMVEMESTTDEASSIGRVGETRCNWSVGETEKERMETEPSLQPNVRLSGRSNTLICEGTVEPKNFLTMRIDTLVF